MKDVANETVCEIYGCYMNPPSPSYKNTAKFPYQGPNFLTGLYKCRSVELESKVLFLPLQDESLLGNELTKLRELYLITVCCYSKLKNT